MEQLAMVPLISIVLNMISIVCEGNNKVILAELLGGRFATLEWQAKKISEKITNPIKIYVNPQNPQESVIFCEGITLYFFIALMGFVAFLIGLVNIF